MKRNLLTFVLIPIALLLVVGLAIGLFFLIRYFIRYYARQKGAQMAKRAEMNRMNIEDL